MNLPDKSPLVADAALDHSPGGLLGATFVGPTLLLSLTLLSIILVGSSSPQYGVGFTVGKIVTSLAFGLPVYFVFRYFTSRGRRLNRKEKLNVLCLITVVVWCLQLAASVFVPYYIATQAGKQHEPPSATSAKSGSDQSAPRLPNGAIDWSQFTPIEKTAPEPDTAGAEAISQPAPSSSRTICKNFFDQFDKGSTCIPASSSQRP